MRGVSAIERAGAAAMGTGTTVQRVRGGPLEQFARFRRKSARMLLRFGAARTGRAFHASAVFVFDSCDQRFHTVKETAVHVDDGRHVAAYDFILFVDYETEREGGHERDGFIGVYFSEAGIEQRFCDGRNDFEFHCVRGRGSSEDAGAVTITKESQPGRNGMI